MFTNMNLGNRIQNTVNGNCFTEVGAKIPWSSANPGVCSR